MVSVDYKCLLWNTTKNYTINRLNNCKLDDKCNDYKDHIMNKDFDATKTIKLHLEELILELFNPVLMVQKVIERIWWFKGYWPNYYCSNYYCQIIVQMLVLINMWLSLEHH